MHPAYRLRFVEPSVDEYRLWSDGVKINSSLQGAVTLTTAIYGPGRRQEATLLKAAGEAR